MVGCGPGALDSLSPLESSTQHAIVAVGANISMVLWFSSDTSVVALLDNLLLHCGDLSLVV